MSDRVPVLDISGPDGHRQTVMLTRDRTTVGRLAELNDVALGPDPQQLVTRHVHCVVERDREGWWVVDNGSVNGTFVQRRHGLEMVRGRAPLTDGDIVRVLARLPETGDPAYWDLLFSDPLKTQPVGPIRREVCVDYDWLEAKLSLVDGTKRVPIALRPQEHKLIRYMAQRNVANGRVPVLCTHDELIAAVWGDQTHHGANDVNHLVWEIRKKIPGGEKAPKFIEAERSMGYRLRTC